jgi:hypothetical protein
MYEAVVQTPEGEKKQRVWAPDMKTARQLLEQEYGIGNVPYQPKAVAN